MTREIEHRFVVDPRLAGSRLDVVLAQELGVSRAEARRLLGRGGVRLGARPVGLAEKGEPVHAGAELVVTAWTPPEDRAPEPDPDAPLRVLDEGSGWVAVDKPAGTPVHPLAPGEGGTVLNALVARRPGVLGVGEGGLRCGVLHRLDVGTSGVLLFATDDVHWKRLRHAFRTHRVAKTYRAVVAGALAGSGEERVRLAVTRPRPARVRVVAEHDDAEGGGPGRPTRLRWRALQPLEGATLVEVDLGTGFLHQIRAVFAHRGHPVAGDEAYGGPDLGVASRPLLHASRLAWEEIDVAAPDPEDLRAAVARLEPGPGA
ncbi:MAG: RluA family pseudouridine synthase [Myxococcota bacterium]|nr:RluA family pseudouridine synthase [Myxococcota bacterium]